MAGWWADQRQETVAYLVEENRILRAHLRGRIRLTDEERRAIAGADFFTTVVWMWRGLVTYYTGAECQCYAERFVRSIKEECLDRMIPLGERHCRRAVEGFVIHYHRERHHQGLGNQLIDGVSPRRDGSVHRHSRLGGLLNYYERAA